MSMLLGKQELLQWAAQTSHIHPCSKYDDLKDGLIFLVLADKLFPALADPSVSRPQRNGPRNPKLNWEVLLSMLGSAGVPTDVCDKKGIGAGHQKPCYNMLVMFYFLSKLKLSSDFAVDFAHPIDDRLAAFLQSERSLECLRGIQPGSHSTPGGRSVSPAHPAPSPSRTQRAPKSHPKPSGASHTPAHHDPQTNSSVAQIVHQPPAVQESVDPGAVKWDSADAHHHGEAVIVRLRADVKIRQRQVQFLQDELTHVKKLGQHTMEQQRVLVESEMMRASQQFQSQLAMVKLEASHSVASTARRFEAELEAALQQFEVERVVSSYGSKQPAQAELLHLKESKLALEKKVSATEARCSAIEDEKQIIREQLGAQTTVIERMHRTVQAAEKALADPENFQLDGISEAAQALVRSRFREVGQENASLKAQVQRLEEEVKGASDTRAGDPSESNFELAQCRQRIQELESVNAFLRKQTQQGLTHNGPSQRDFMQEVVKDETTGNDISIPSSCVNGLSVDELSAQTMDLITSLKPQLEDDTFNQLQDQFWKLGSGVSVLRHRLDAASDHLRHVMQSNKEQVKVFTAEKRRLHNEVAAISRERQMDARQVDEGGNLSQAKLEISLLSDELQQTRREAQSTNERLKAQLSDMLKDSDRQHSELRSSSAKLSRHVAVLLSREQQYKQLTSLLEQRHRQPTDRQIHEAQISSLQSSLDVTIDQQVLQEARQSGAVDADNQVAQATATLRHHYTNTVGELDHAKAENAALRDSLKQLTLQVESLEASTKRSVAELETSRRETQILEGNLRQTVDQSSMAQSQFDAERESWRTAKLELENFASKVGNSKVDGSRVSWEKPKSSGSVSASQATHAQTPSASAAMTDEAATEFLTKWEQPKASSQIMDDKPYSAVTFASSSYPIQTSTPAASATPATPQQQQQAAPSSGGSSVLSPKELERRKLEILSKYGVSNSSF